MVKGVAVILLWCRKRNLINWATRRNKLIWLITANYINYASETDIGADYRPFAQMYIPGAAEESPPSHALNAPREMRISRAAYYNYNIADQFYPAVRIEGRWNIFDRSTQPRDAKTCFRVNAPSCKQSQIPNMVAIMCRNWRQSGAWRLHAQFLIHHGARFAWDLFDNDSRE